MKFILTVLLLLLHTLYLSNLKFKILFRNNGLFSARLGKMCLPSLTLLTPTSL